MFIKETENKDLKCWTMTEWPKKMKFEDLRQHLVLTLGILLPADFKGNFRRPIDLMEEAGRLDISL